MLFKRIKDWATSITAFRSGDVIPVDGPSGTAKMPVSELPAAIFGNSIDEAVAAWLDGHPEATTTVQDSSLTEAKFSDALKLKTIKDYVTPEMFGAVGDGVTDDSTAIQAAINFCRSSQGRGAYVLLNAQGVSNHKYYVGSDIYLTNGVTLQGTTRWGAWLDLHDGAQVCLVTNPEGHSTEESRLKFLTIDGNDTSEYCVRTGAPGGDDYVATQCVLEDVYMKNAATAACYFRGTITQFNHCYFYYSPTGLIARGCNGVIVRDCNFWDIQLTLDMDRCSNINFIGDWFEGGNVSDRGLNNVQIKVSNNSNVFFENCQFQGTVSATQYILKQPDGGNRNNFSLLFNQCRFNYPYAENSLFEFHGWDNIHLQIENSYFYCPLMTAAIIDNSHTKDSQSLKYAICNNTAYDDDSKAVPLFTDPTRCLAVSVFADNDKNLPQLPNGVKVGNGLPDTENNLKALGGYGYYSDATGRLRFTDGTRFRNIAYETYITPEEFGAVGDGVTDDSAAIQAAIDAATGNSVVLLTRYSYNIANDIYLGNACTISGSIRQTGIKLSNGAQIKLGKGSIAPVEIRLKNLSINAQNTSDCCVTQTDLTLNAYQIYFEDVYMGGAVVSACRLYGERIQFNRCYFSESICGLKLQGKYNYIENSLFSGNALSVDVDGANFYFLNDLFETTQKILTVSSGSSARFSDCSFLGKSGACYMMNETSDKSIDLVFVRCTIKYDNPTNTSSIFTLQCSSSQNIYLRFYECSILAYYCTNFIDNSGCADYHFRLAWVAVSDFGTNTNIVSNEGYKRIDLDISSNAIGIPGMNSGMVLGSNTPAADSYLNSYNGYVKYDTAANRLKMVADGSQRIIPVQTIGTLSDLPTDAVLSTVISRINDLLVMLRESKVLKS